MHFCDSIISYLKINYLQNDSDYVKHQELKKESKKNDKKIVVEEINAENSSPQDLIDSGFSTIETQVKTELLAGISHMSIKIL